MEDRTPLNGDLNMRRSAVIPLVVIFVTARASHAQVMPAPNVGRPIVTWRLEVAAGGGFAGLTEVEVQSEPNLLCDAGAPPVCTIDPANKMLIRNSAYSWRPAVSTGLVIRRLFEPSAEDVAAEALGVGVGAHFVFVPKSEGASRPAPALAVHFGKATMQVFAGFIFVPTAKASLPGNRDRAIVPNSFDQSSLIRNDAGKGPSFFAGIVVGGVAVTKGS
jgi:hypothetical protein